jgi:hypothetical protein
MKIKTSLTLSKDLIKDIDKLLGKKRGRSAFVERVLREYFAAQKAQNASPKTADNSDENAKPQPIEQVVEAVVQDHFETEPGLDEIIWFKNGAAGKICLIEINRYALPGDAVFVFSFAPCPPEVPFPIRIADVTPQDWERIKQGEIPLPPGWLFKNAQVFHRPKE